MLAYKQRIKYSDRELPQCLADENVGCKMQHFITRAIAVSTVQCQADFIDMRRCGFIDMLHACHTDSTPVTV
jgi:hypothetical protein